MTAICAGLQASGAHLAILVWRRVSRVERDAITAI